MSNPIAQPAFSDHAWRSSIGFSVLCTLLPVHLQYDSSPERLYSPSCLQFAIGEPACAFWTSWIHHRLVLLNMLRLSQRLELSRLPSISALFLSGEQCDTYLKRDYDQTCCLLLQWSLQAWWRPLCTVVKHYETRLFVLHCKIRMRSVLLRSCTVGKQIPSLSDHDTILCHWNASNNQIVGSNGFESKEPSLMQLNFEQQSWCIHDVFHMDRGGEMWSWDESSWLMACSHSNAAWASSLSSYRWKDWYRLIARCQCNLAPIHS